MATTRLMPLHTGKGRTVGQAISDIIDYTENPQKTDGGRLITSWQCDSRIADAEFLFTKNQYIQKTGRVRGEDNVIAYHLRQSFVPGEITPEELESARRSLISAVRAGLDTPAALDDWYIGMSIEPCDDPETMLQKLPALTVGDVVRAARRITTDTIYFLKGDEA